VARGERTYAIAAISVADPTQRVLGGRCDAVINAVQRASQAVSTAISRVSSQGA
jgi:hypothetical protein